MADDEEVLPQQLANGGDNWQGKNVLGKGRFD